MWPLGFVVPAYQLFDQPFYGIGLKVYDMLAGDLSLAGSRWLNHREVLAAAPNLAEHVGGARCAAATCISTASSTMRGWRWR